MPNWKFMLSFLYSSGILSDEFCKTGSHIVQIKTVIVGEKNILTVQQSMYSNDFYVSAWDCFPANINLVLKQGSLDCQSFHVYFMHLIMQHASSVMPVCHQPAKQMNRVR